MPVAYAVTYIFGTVGSAIVICHAAGPKLLGIDLASACKDYEARIGGGEGHRAVPALAWRRLELRAYRARRRRQGRRSARQRCRSAGDRVRASSSSASAAMASIEDARWPTRSCVKATSSLSPVAREMLVNLIGQSADESRRSRNSLDAPRRVASTCACDQQGRRRHDAG